MIAALVATGSYTAWAAQPGAASNAAPSKKLGENQAKSHALATPVNHSDANKALAKPSIPAVSNITHADNLTPPKYPADAVAKRQSGKVVLQLLVGTDGAVKHVKVASSEPAGLFDQVSVEAASKWHFTPASRTSTGEKVEGWVQVPVQFELDPIAKSATP